MSNDRPSLDQSHAARLSRFRDASLLEAAKCDANGYASLAAGAYGEARAYAIAINVITGRSAEPVVTNSGQRS